MTTERQEVLQEAVNHSRRASHFISRVFIVVVLLFGVSTGVSFVPGTGLTARYVLDTMGGCTLHAYSALWFVGAVMTFLSLFSSRLWRVTAPFVGMLMASLVALYAFEWLTGDSEVRWYSVKNYMFMWATYMIAVYYSARELGRKGGARGSGIAF